MTFHLPPKIKRYDCPFSLFKFIWFQRTHILHSQSKRARIERNLFTLHFCVCALLHLGGIQQNGWIPRFFYQYHFPFARERMVFFVGHILANCDILCSDHISAAFQCAPFHLLLFFIFQFRLFYVQMLAFFPPSISFAFVC